MILIDANLLIFAHFSSLPQHAAGKRWLDARLNERIRVGLPWPSLLAFLRIATSARVFERPESIADAWRQVEAWLSRGNVWIPVPGEDHPAILARMLGLSGGANRVPDAHLAALALEHGLTLCSSDGDFARFTGLKWENPLAV
ncbi:MAG TPA: TA system VapC family ribonuclease toxin [Bryobacteraceae bacterium]|nr:TA system VapC family ribonuclease toxin [Bryobacteraceae bacterium]